ncbi:hypothetical protein [Caballeronia sp. S22]|uniref:hypothetical protein n=1 Tax=Caballeronia sp. S22 TaxID=3137182 RepID=UPI003530C035
MGWNQVSLKLWCREDGAAVWETENRRYANPLARRPRLWEGCGPKPDQMLVKTLRTALVGNVVVFRRFENASNAMKAVDENFPEAIEARSVQSVPEDKQEVDGASSVRGRSATAYCESEFGLPHHGCTAKCDSCSGPGSELSRVNPSNDKEVRYVLPIFLRCAYNDSRPRVQRSITFPEAPACLGNARHQYVASSSWMCS